jgi:predicted small secreted protein
MKKLTTLFIVVTMAFLLAACATVQDVQRATDLIRTDNELTRLLVEVRPNDQIGAALYLSALATHAKAEADNLKGDPRRAPDAIAYYRIAATAYWRSGKSEVINELFEVTDNGAKLCAALGKSAPDRDCLFLQLVIPFAGMESNVKNANLPVLLDGVDFSDQTSTTEEIDTMAKIHKELMEIKPLVEKILTVGLDDSFMTHPGMREYYCANAQKAVDYYDLNAGEFVSHVRVFHDKFPDNTPPLGVTLDEARGLRKLEREIPSFCP